MTEKELKAKLIAEIERLKLCTMDEHMGFYSDAAEAEYNALLKVEAFINSLPEEPVKIKKGCKYRCLSDMVNKDTGNIAFVGDKIYLAPKDNTLVSEENGWLCDTSENASNFELVEEPVGNSDWLKELQDKLDNATPEQLQELWDKYHDDEDDNDPIGDDLKEAAIEICSKILKGETVVIDGYEYVVLSDAEECFKAGVKWQAEKGGKV